MKILAVIPARGGSKGIPRKNIRFMAGQPLISYAINCAKSSSYNIDVAVTSDDEEIKNVASIYGAEIINRSPGLAGDKVTLDPVIYDAVLQMEREKDCRYDIVITMQPTSPLLSVETLDAAISYHQEKQLDTVISGVNDPRLSWYEEEGVCLPNYKERLNRQYMPKDLKETGAFVITKREFVKETGRFGKKISVYEMPEREAGDIDTAQDWWIAEMELNRKTILIRLDGYSEIGMGHVYRGLQLASMYIEHSIRFVISEKSDIGICKLEDSHYKYDIIKDNDDIFELIDKYNADVVVNDILNTSENYIIRLKQSGVRVVNFEDLGLGAKYADAVINALYDKPDNCELDENSYWGSDYYLIRDEFNLAKPKPFSSKVNEILVIFGGTDPCNLTEKTIEALSQISDNNMHVTVILGMGYKGKDKLAQKMQEQNIDVVQDVKLMTSYMGKADLAISSQGRTMLELASMGVPTILMSQNARESTHAFGEIKNGFLNLGLGSEVEIHTLAETISWLNHCPQIRCNMRQQMLQTDLRHGAERVKKIILGEK